MMAYCPRCNGTILRLDTDGDGCLQCGYRPPSYADELPRLYSAKTTHNTTYGNHTEHKNRTRTLVSIDDIRDAMKARLYEAQR